MWQNYIDDDIVFVGISNTNNQNIINNFIEENSLTFPILYDTGSPGGVQGGDVYDLYYMPNDGSPYPRDFIIDQDGIIAYANNEIDTAWMLSVLDDLLHTGNGIMGDINQDNVINVLDIITLINFILSEDVPMDDEFSYSDLNSDNVLNVLDIVILVNLILN
ncbi:MAG: hypothetical protein CMG46_00695 [Candidatus Marinimicrobia bacterium]|nr:hypothetical protein [Candidatus Neomarinimicrobiota bacterium]